MNIRALTGFLDPGWPVDSRLISDLASCLGAARDLLAEAGYPVQSLRLATPPPAEFSRPVPPAARAALARQLEAECFVHGIDYAALGPALPEEPEGFASVPEVLASTENVFASALFADPESGLSLVAARACAQTIADSATLRPDGFANLRFAALANVPAGAPFFPAAYHRGGPMALAVATEAAELAVDALRDVPSLATARRRLVSMVEAHAAAITRFTQRVTAEREAQFLGIDFSFAPYPDHARSLGAALEALGVPAAGLAGTVAAAAFLTDCLDQAQFLRTGFCGLLLPPLEDDTLAARAAEGSLTVTDLLLCSAVCGTGLDTLPLPGDTTVDQMTALLLDLGALALRLDKPLTARLMPIPGKAAGDEVHFDFPYFADSRVMTLRARPLSGLLAAAASLDLRPHRP
jgi:uncharacterized protein (UPF0210 family)